MPMAWPIRVHCERCGQPQWLLPQRAAMQRKLACPRCGHHAGKARLKLIRARGRQALEPAQPALRLAG